MLFDYSFWISAPLGVDCSLHRRYLVGRTLQLDFRTFAATEREGSDWNVMFSRKTRKLFTFTLVLLKFTVKAAWTELFLRCWIQIFQSFERCSGALSIRIKQFALFIWVLVETERLFQIQKMFQGIQLNSLNLKNEKIRFWITKSIFTKKNSGWTIIWSNPIDV